MNEFERLVKEHEAFLKACKNFVEGWDHFLSRINFGGSAFDAPAIRFMNEIPGEIEKAVKTAESR